MTTCSSLILVCMALINFSVLDSNIVTLHALTGIKTSEYRIASDMIRV